MNTKTVERTAAADLRWLKSAEHFSQWERFDEVTGEREELFMMKSTKSPAVRFYALGKGQIGPNHAHVVAATYWAYGNGYLGVCERPEDIFLEIACRQEVLAGGTERPV